MKSAVEWSTVTTFYAHIALLLRLFHKARVSVASLGKSLVYEDNCFSKSVGQSVSQYVLSLRCCCLWLPVFFLEHMASATTYYLEASNFTMCMHVWNDV